MNINGPYLFAMCCCCYSQEIRERMITRDAEEALQRQANMGENEMEL